MAESVSSRATGKARVRAENVLSEVASLPLPDGESAEALFDDIVSRFDDLDEELQTELANAAGVLEGRAASEIQRKASRDGELELTVSEDQMEAWLRVIPPKGQGKPVTPATVIAELKQRRIRAPIREKAMRRALAQLAETGEPVDRVCVCRGKLPKNGEDGRLELLFEPGDQDAAGSGPQSGRLSKKVELVKAGQPLARVVPATPGKAGHDVFGQTLPPQPGAEAMYQLGENVAYHPAEGVWVAEIDGVPEFEKACLSVRNHYVVEGDIDITSGDVEFSGTVTVEGSVRDGTCVRARDDILIHGTVEAAEVVSENGSVTVRQGIKGRDRGIISAAGDIEAQFAENGRLYAGNCIRLQASIRSDLCAGDSILIDRGRGVAIGGALAASHLVDVKSLGSPANVPMQVVLGMTREDQDALRELDRSIVSLKATRDKITASLREFEVLSPDSDKLTDVEKTLYARLKKASVVTAYQLRKYEAERKTRLEQPVLAGAGAARVSKALMAGVHFQIGAKCLKITQDRAGAVVRYDPHRKEIVCTSYK